MSHSAFVIVLLGVGYVLGDTLHRHCYDIDPNKRLDCGYYGIRKEECEVHRGCCYDDTVQGVPWCFRSKTDLADKCRSIDVKKRADCGWIGINKDVCEGRGCCYDDRRYNMGSKYCFYPKSSKCYDIAPENRKDCGYFGIGRDECEKERDCCFDHTVQNVPWCFFGHKRPPSLAPQTKAPTEKPTEEGVTEGSAEELTEQSVGARIVPGG